MRRHGLAAALLAAIGLTWAAPASAWENLQQGRMTGGGNFTCTGANGTIGKVTYGFEVHCSDSQTPNNFEINWDGNHFHLQALTSAECIDDPSISPTPPVAPFDTYFGEGTGLYDGQSGAKIYFNLTDAGEPGTHDTIAVTILDAAGDVVLDCDTTTLTGGNNQAHRQTP